MRAFLDEATPADRGGVYYVIAAALLITEPEAARWRVREVLPVDRSRAFHWRTEGPRARAAMLEAVDELGIVAHVCVHYPTGRSHLERARRAVLQHVIPRLIGEGVDDVTLEQRTATQNDLDRRAILDVLRDDTAGALTYRWAGKEEPLLWVADALAGAVREYLLGQNDHYFEVLQRCGAVGEIDYIAGA